MPTQWLPARFAYKDSFKPALFWLINAILLCIMLFFSVQAIAEESKVSIDPELQRHIDLIENALETDAYNKRCRGISVSKALNKVNRLYVTKYSLTANNFIKNYIDRDVRAIKADRQHSFNHRLNKIGGCKAAKDEGSVKQLKIEFKALYEQAEKSPWYPE